jgi:DNA (cytosine-5)-methyltransferase 1
LFSGIEAATVAWHPLGWEPVFFSEIAPFPCAVLAHHYPTVPNFGDANNFLEWKNETIDVIVGGSPCQSFSVAGRRKGLDDPRGNLMFTYINIIGKYCPRWVLWENVPGVLSIDGGRAFKILLGALAKRGYGFAYRILDAQYFGVPQRRRRVYVVGHSGGAWRRSAAVLFEPHDLRVGTTPRRAAREDIARTLVAFDTRGGWSNWQPVQTFRAPDEKELANIGTEKKLIKTDAPTNAVRTLTPTECEALQGFPRDYTRIPYRGKPASQCPDTPRYRALGNSMAVPVMRWIGERIQAVDSIDEVK